MLKVDNLEYLAKVCDFADSKGQQHHDDLWETLWRLHCMGRDRVDHESSMPPVALGQRTIPPAWFEAVRGATTTYLYPDFAPASFGFGSNGIGGGVIYRGDQSGWTMPSGEVIPPGYGVETFSVSFGNTMLWSINT